tara:strand:+ start:201 stop:935 length:735 start_codon:yes stop_codon:yes gene_type:complete
MVLPSSGAISLGQIATEYSDSQPNSMNEFYRGGGKVPTTVSGSATQAAPSSNDTYSDFGGVTGLTLVRTTPTTSTGFVAFRTFNAGAQGGPTSFYPTNNQGFFPNDGNPFTRIDVRLRRTSGNSASGKISRNSQVPAGDFTTIDTTGNSHLLTVVTKQGSYRYNVGDNSQVKEEQNRYRADPVYTFTNNTGYDVTIEGTTVANGASSAISPSGDFNISYTILANPNVPSSGTIDFADFYGGRAS